MPILDFARANTCKRKPSLSDIHPVDRKCISSITGQRLAEYLSFNLDTGPWLAGGAVRKSYLGLNIEKSDWDIWFSAPEQFHKADQLLTDLSADLVFESENAKSYRYRAEDDETHNIQIIKKQYFDSAEAVIQQFDFSVCQIITDGRTIQLGDYTARDLKDNTLRLTKTELPVSIIPRLVKYIVYGYKPNQQLLEIIDQNINNINWTVTTNDYETI